MSSCEEPCRLCLRECSNQNLNARKRQYRQVLLKVFPGIRFQSDVICHGCWTNAKNIYDFKIKCFKVEETLNSYRRENNVMQLTNNQLRSVSKKLGLDNMCALIDLTGEDKDKDELVCIDLVSKSSSCSSDRLADEDDDIFDEVEIRKNETNAFTTDEGSDHFFEDKIDVTDTQLLIPDVGIWDGPKLQDIEHHIPAFQIEAGNVRNWTPSSVPSEKTPNAVCKTCYPRPKKSGSACCFDRADYANPLDLSVVKHNKQAADQGWHGNKLWCCHVCLAWYEHKCSLLHHLRVHSAQQLFESLFSYRAAPQNAPGSVANKFFVCPYCCNAYPQKPLLISHIVDRHMSHKI
ncbi:uncharacterized protein LOC132699622 isoform X2 [Cylas formicarius]|uniref:uncharacterized protein LOC132699622 isoform X2 n=1 Tax=Cylas formicarius TaxID=197179 RepID=UPI002958DA2C|nr:uncharacterized protein LOC132699622 isoform X2 [Cylas formicarius]